MSNIYNQVTKETFELVELKENYSFEMHAHFNPILPNALTTFPDVVQASAFKLSIKRNFLDDTFSMYWPVYTPQSPPLEAWDELDWSASTSNKVTVGKTNGLLPLVHERHFDVTMAKSFSLDNIKFREATS